LQALKHLGAGFVTAVLEDAQVVIDLFINRIKSVDLEINQQ
jgi:hypothetical protein